MAKNTEYRRADGYDQLELIFFFLAYLPVYIYYTKNSGQKSMDEGDTVDVILLVAMVFCFMASTCLSIKNKFRDLDAMPYANSLKSISESLYPLAGMVFFSVLYSNIFN